MRTGIYQFENLSMKIHGMTFGEDLVTWTCNSVSCRELDPKSEPDYLAEEQDQALWLLQRAADSLR